MITGQVIGVAGTVAAVIVVVYIVALLERYETVFFEYPDLGERKRAGILFRTSIDERGRQVLHIGTKKYVMSYGRLEDVAIRFKWYGLRHLVIPVGEIGYKLRSHRSSSSSSEGSGRTK